jgi:superoxide dismutase, Cu-Zn family
MNAKWMWIAACALLPACGGMSSIFQVNPSATAALGPTRGNQASGTVYFAQKGSVVHVDARVSGLAPYGAHGIHVHVRCDCSAADASSAGGHFDPPAARDIGAGAGRGHAGELGVLRADASGHAVLKTELTGISLSAGELSVIGRSVIVHADSGTAGTDETARIACGLISKNPDKYF